MAKVTKERVANICRRVNQGSNPSSAVKADGLGGLYLTSLKESGILYKDPITGRWQGMMRIHDERYEKFTLSVKRYNAVANSRAVRKKKEVFEAPTQKTSIFRRIWRSIFG